MDKGKIQTQESNGHPVDGTTVGMFFGEVKNVKEAIALKTLAEELASKAPANRTATSTAKKRKPK
jgi:hypothetical protein